MPFINIKTNAKKDKKTQEEIVKIVRENTAAIFHKDSELVSILVEFVPEDSWTIGTKIQNTFYLDIKITKGINTKEEKANYIKKTFSDLDNILGGVHFLSCVHIDEVDASSWGYEGITQEYRYIKSMIN